MLRFRDGFELWAGEAQRATLIDGRYSGCRFVGNGAFSQLSAPTPHSGADPGSIVSLGPMPLCLTLRTPPHGGRRRVVKATPPA